MLCTAKLQALDIALNDTKFILLLFIPSPNSTDSIIIKSINMFCASNDVALRCLHPKNRFMSSDAGARRCIRIYSRRYPHGDPFGRYLCFRNQAHCHSARILTRSTIQGSRQIGTNVCWIMPVFQFTIRETVKAKCIMHYAMADSICHSHSHRSIR